MDSDLGKTCTVMENREGCLLIPRNFRKFFKFLSLVDGSDESAHLKLFHSRSSNFTKRLRSLVKQLERGEASVVDLKKNLEYAATVLESVYIDETSLSPCPAMQDVDKWSFDVFSLNEASGDHALKFIFYELLTRYDLISRFKIPISALVSFVEALEVGYSKHKNPYHNLMHAADVTQTVHYLLYKTGVANWLTELEIFAIIFSAAIHDYEHTGTTNNFHIQTRSDPAILYNDKSVLENHHLSAAYRLLQEDEEMNILINLSKDDWREFRTLVIEMVMATDMSCHFQQIKAMKTALQQPEAIEKPKALSLMLHTADISHPAKAWELHHRWTMSLLEEFFRQLAMGTEEKAKKEAEEKARLAAEEKQKEMEAKSQAEEGAAGKAEKKTSGEAKNQVNGTCTNKSDNPYGKNSKAEKSSGEKQQNGEYSFTGERLFSGC
ncbi:calcium/calmodulin-dependent 3',5'-cyclic nucleotide phosphodiesterase 1C-like [Leptonychotes weddellii]|uniref:Phosphodiesterase n=1 Tax=Leptonychotes weddellii TaxID=9713 RepID=A0A7F8QAG2_LEPWE|nr:calcium/calmodulin-dependent 3',5'-cyclic nucleotide phosphodiesterase 1C-like [Leptonychotes weddellii]